MTNTEFLNIITLSFKKFLETGSRSNEKLKILHGAIAKDIKERLGSNYNIKSLGYDEGREVNIHGRYIDKKVDITITKEDKTIAGIGVKFVMQNYEQNSNNYFENMLGETANIRCNNTPYFQIFIIPENLPYYDNNGNLKHWEKFNDNNVRKYITLSNDDITISTHTPTKTLLFVIEIPKSDDSIFNKEQYKQHYQDIDNLIVEESKTEYGKFNNSVIYNDYEVFATKVAHYILSI